MIPELAWLIREIKQTMTESATTASLSKRFNEQKFGCARSLKSLYNILSHVLPKKCEISGFGVDAAVRYLFNLNKLLD